MFNLVSTLESTVLSYPRLIDTYFMFWFHLGPPHIPTGLDPIRVTPRASYGRPVGILRNVLPAVSHAARPSIVVNLDPSGCGLGLSKGYSRRPSRRPATPTAAVTRFSEQRPRLTFTFIRPLWMILFIVKASGSPQPKRP